MHMNSLYALLLDMSLIRPWQHWISSHGVFDNATASPKRDSIPGNGNNSVSTQPQPQFQPATTGASGASSGGRTLALNADVIADILAAARAMLSWKACQVEGTSWTGTAEGNMSPLTYKIVDLLDFLPCRLRSPLGVGTSIVWKVRLARSFRRYD